MKKSCSNLQFNALVALVALALTWMPGATARADEKGWQVPIVMEEATVRGKIAILETRSADRSTPEGVLVEVWTTKVPETPEKKHWWQIGKPEREVARDEKIHETKTDDVGLFDLPLIETGDYMMVIGNAEFSLQVIPKSEERSGQTEPKVLLILIPKNVLDV